MSAWNIGDITRVDSLISGAEVKVVETGPVCAAVEVKHTFLNSSLTQQIRVYSGLDRIDFMTEVDWHENGTASTDAPMLKTTFTPYFDDSKVVYEIPYGTIERPAHGREVPALRWADISEGGCGLSLINNSKYGHHAQGNTLALTLVRASYEPDNNPDEGLHRINYSIYAHKGSWADAGTELRGSQFNQPLLVAIEGAHSGAVVPGKAYIASSPSNVVISAVKFAEDQPDDANAVVVRLFEDRGEPVSAQLSLGWPVLRAEEVDMMENAISPMGVDSDSVTFDLGKHEIKTIKLYVKK
jgi:alpha-mannosidase